MDDPLNDSDPFNNKKEHCDKPAFIFISHKQEVELDEKVAKLLYAELQREGFDVYLDKERPPGVNWEGEIRENLKKADVLVALISNQANRSDWMKLELHEAYKLHQANHRPVIIPVPLGLTEDYDLRIAQCVSGFNPVSCDPEDFSSLLEQVLYGIKHERMPKPPGGDSPPGMEGFLVSNTMKKQVLASYVEPSRLKGLSELLHKKRLLWISGDQGVRNYLAVCLAVKEQVNAVYEVSKPRPWSKINNTLVRNSAIVLRDVKPSSLFDVEAPKREFDSLASLADRNNYILITLDEAAFLEIEQELRQSDFIEGAHISVQRDDYNDRAKEQIFEKLLSFLQENDRITPTQFNWARKLLEDSSQVDSRTTRQDFWNDCRQTYLQRIRDWSPADVEHFVTLFLPQIKSQNEILRLLQRKLALEDEIHSWFMSLDDSICCFVMVLATFEEASELNDEKLWDKYKTIILDLQKLNSQLAPPPLGACRRRALPYVTQEGPIDFIDEQFARAIIQEIARNYREYFTEILPRLREWSVPPSGVEGDADAKEARAKRINESKDIRVAIAKMIGKAGRQRLDDLVSILDCWATDAVMEIRKAAAISFGELAKDNNAARQALDLLEKWCYDRTPSEQTLWRAKTAALALAQIVSANPKTASSSSALEYLRYLSYDNRNGIRFHTSIALKEIARAVPLSDMKDILERLARRGEASIKASREDVTVRMNVAEALNYAMPLNLKATLELASKWADSSEDKLRWVAFCSLIIRRLPRTRNEQQEARAKREKQEELQKILRQDPVTFVDALIRAIAHNYHHDTAWDAFQSLVQDLTDGSRPIFVSCIAKVPFIELDERLLSLLRSSNDPRLESLVVEIRKETWKELVENPLMLLESIEEALQKEQTRREVFSALVLLTKPEPEGYRQEVVSALASCYPTERQRIHALFATLKELAMAHFESFCFEVYREAYKGLFYDRQAAFVELVNGALSHPEFSIEMRNILESLALHEPVGCRDQLQKVLSVAYGMNSYGVKLLLANLRNSGSFSLSQFARDFKQQFLEGGLSYPRGFISRVLEDLDDIQEREETLAVLNQLAALEPFGKRSKFIDALALAKLTDGAAVESFLQNRAILAFPNLVNIRKELKYATDLKDIFAPKFGTS